MQLKIIALAAALALAGCGKGSQTDTVDDSTLTPLKGAALIEGTVNDASALETAAEANNIAPLATENATDEANDPANAM